MYLRKMYVQLVSLVVCALLFPSIVLATEDANSLYRQAIALEREGKFFEALTLYQQVISTYSDSAFAGTNFAVFRSRYMAAAIAVKSDDITGAKAITEQIRNLAGLQPAYLYKAANLFRGIDSDYAITIYQQILSAYQYCMQATYSKIFIDQRTIGNLIRGRNDSQVPVAIDKLINDFSAHPNSLGSALTYIADRYLETEKYPEAKSVFERLIVSCPNTVHATYARAKIAQSQILANLDFIDEAASRQAI